MANLLALPTNAEIQMIERQLLPVLTFDNPAFDLFPLVTKDAVEMIWEQEQNILGLQSGRGNGDPQTIRLLGANRYEMTPGSYGDAIFIDEKQIEEARKYGTFNLPAPETYLVYKAQDQALNRRINRMAKNIWDLLTTGTFSVPNDTGGYNDIGTYPFRTVSAAFSWATLATATPLADFRALKPLHRGYSTWFDKRAKAYMNTTQVNYMLNNQNQNDLGGKRRDVGASIFTLEEVNEINAAQDLPQIVEYDEGYYPETIVNGIPTQGTFQLFIPTGTVVVVGVRPAGQTIGEFQMTRNAVNDDSEPGAYTFVTDSKQSGKPVPRWVRVDDGFKGGPACFFPSSVVIMSA